MTPQGRASGLPAALLLLWVPGCLSLSGPRRVTGTVGGSLSVQCRYEKEYTNHNKYWCNGFCLVKIVETTESEREMRRGRVSIRDHPANLTFTVTLESLTEDNEGKYSCGIDRPWREKLTDLTFQVVVSVSPATSRPATTTTTTTAAATTSTATAQTPTVSSAPAGNVTRSKNSQDSAPPSPDLGLPVLLILLALLLLLLGGASLLAWRMVRRRVKAGGNPEPLQNHCQAAPQSEPCYANLELQPRPLQGEPEHPRQEEVEYSLVQPPREDLHYSTVVFTAQHRDPEDQSPSQRPPRQEPEYSVVRKT
ncbi:CMRF35-like molecule 8 isoform X2 [Eptesicus fuscus]|uniref:CMRF35-like molecule 8 isoform X2 n=1 Tax=Eptesicus fuscus TaxID=29078 RepID=UPI002403B140|nr:CMRF35-like molecule 8 isoform X2 [Eptesicus fuscus]